MKKILLIITAILIAVNVSYSQIIQFNKQKSKAIDSLLMKYSKIQSNTGIAVGIVYNDKLIYGKTAGYKDVNKNDLVTSQTLFHLGSVPKVFVATAIMKLVEDGTLDLDSTVIKYLPYLKFDDERYKDITIKHLLNHSSGIYTYMSHDWDKPELDDEALKRVVKKLNYNKLLFKPGDKFKYSDTNYDILGAVIHEVTEIPFEVYMKKYILVPSGMKQSTFYLPDTNLVAMPHIDNYDNCSVVRSTLHPYNRAHAPCGTLYSNIDEMCNWMIMNMNHGKYNNKQVIKENTHKAIWQPTIKTGWAELYENMGIGWFIGKINNKKIMIHSGEDHGYKAVFGVIPEDSIGIVLLSNYRQTPSHAIFEKIIDIIYDKKNAQNRGKYINKSEFSKLTGNYYDDENNIVKIYIKNNRPFLKYKDQSCCLCSRSGNFLAGKYMSGNNYSWYNDKSNVFLLKDIKEGKIVYSITFDWEKFFIKK